MRVKLVLPTSISLALLTAFISAIPAVADKPAPTPHASASDGVVWGSGHRRAKREHAKSDDSANEAKSGSDQGTAPLKSTPTPVVSYGGAVWCEDYSSRYRCRLHDTTTPPTTTTKKKKPTKTKTAPTQPQLRKVAAKLKLPDATPRFGPDPSVNEWKMLAVGFPIWLWTDRPTTITTTAHNDGLSFTLTATWTSTTFTMGDGHTKTCTATTIRPKHLKPATKPSPTCGYTYQTKSKIGHPYTVTADTHWNIDWTTNGYHGTFTHTYTGQRTLEIGELQSLING